MKQRLDHITRTNTLAKANGFSLIDLLVSMAVIAVLVSLISPTLAHVRNAANKVVCASNLRQVGLCLSMYRDDNDQLLPQERQSATREGTADPQIAHTGEDPGAWSSLGWLVADGYISTPQVFYCPAHEGTQTEEFYATAWMNLDSPIRVNYAYRGELAQHAHDNDDMLATTSAPYSSARRTAAASVLISDAFTSANDLNHNDGFNTLTADLGVNWLSDQSQQILALVNASGAGGVSPDDAWSILDRNSPEAPLDPGNTSTQHSVRFAP